MNNNIDFSKITKTELIKILEDKNIFVDYSKLTKVQLIEKVREGM